jgi:choline dehydrogenase-like flavoprotein
MDTGNLTLRTQSIAREVLVDTATGKAKGVSFVDADSGRTLEAKAKVVVLAASTLESARLRFGRSREQVLSADLGNGQFHKTLIPAPH